MSINRIHGGGVPLVGSDHALTGAMAAQHLLGLGHRLIGTVAGPRDQQVEPHPRLQIGAAGGR